MRLTTNGKKETKDYPLLVLVTADSRDYLIGVLTQ